MLPLNLSCLHKLIVFIEGKIDRHRAMFSRVDLDIDLFFCLIYCLWIYFGVSVLALICTRSFSVLFFFCVCQVLTSVVNYTVPGSFRHTVFNSTKTRGVNECAFLELDTSSFLSLTSTSTHPQSSLSFSPLIFPWIGVVFPFAIKHKARGIAATSLHEEIAAVRCGLAAAGCGAVYTERLTMYLLCGCLCCVIPGFVTQWWRPVTLLAVVQRLLMLL